MNDERELPTEYEDVFANEVLTAGGVLARMRLGNAVEGFIVELPPDEAGLPRNSFWIKTPYMRSRYRVTITMDPDPAYDQSLAERVRELRP